MPDCQAVPDLHIIGDDKRDCMKEYHIAVQREITPLYLDIKKALDKGRAVKVTVTSQATKTQEQLGYYWGVVLPRVQEGLKEFGNEMSLAEVNQFLNDKFFCNCKTVIVRRGLDELVYTLRTPRSKSGASKDEMSEFLERVIRFAAVDLGVEIPSPEEMQAAEVPDTDTRGRQEDWPSPF